MTAEYDIRQLEALKSALEEIKELVSGKDTSGPGDQKF